MEDKSFVHIKAHGLPGIFPNEDLTGRWWQIAPRIISDSDFSITVPTDRKYQLINDPSFRIRNIQVQIFNKYEIWVFADEDTNINLWNKVHSLWIYTNDGNGGDTIEHKAFVLNDIVATKQQLSGTHKFKYTIQYADININNYMGEDPISNFLESRSVFENSLFGNPGSVFGINKIDFRLDTAKSINNEFEQAWNQYYSNHGQGEAINKYVINTAIQPIEMTVERMSKPHELPDGTIKLARLVQVKIKRLVFYLGEIEKNLVERYLPYCHDGSASTTLMQITGAGNFLSLENIRPQISELDEGIDIYEVIIDLPYEIIDFSPL